MASFSKADSTDLHHVDVSDSDDEIEKNAELFWAIRKRELQKIAQLLDSGVKVNIIDRNNKDNTPLHSAIEKGNKEIVEELLLPKWINAKNNKGDTPLHISIRKGNTELVHLLLSKQVKIDIKNKQGEIPLDIAKRLKPEWRDIIQILETQLDSQVQKLEYQSCQQPSDHAMSIPTKQEESQHRNENTNEDIPNTQRKQGHPVDGFIYQLKLLMLFLHRGVSLEYSFRLGTEIEEAKKFDDLVFECTKGGSKEYRLFQAKHKKNECKKITYDLLTESKGDFNIAKYFFSYQACKNEDLFKYSSIKDVTICTNIDLDVENLKRAQIKVEKIEDKDDILYVESDKKPMRYRFSKDATSVIKRILEDYNVKRLKKKEKRKREEKEDKNWPYAVSDDEIKDFLDNFVFAVNQPNEVELEQIIKDEIGKKYYLNMTENKNIYNEFFMTMLNLLQGKKTDRFFTFEEGKEFFEEARRGIPIWFRAKKPVHWFTGRKQELNDLHEKVQRCRKKITVISQMTTISGLGGIGKTELARQYIYKHSNDYDNNVVWVNAESELSLIQSFHNLAQNKLGISTKNKEGLEKDIKSIMEEIYRFFAKRRSLFIFDSADKSNDLKKFLPFGGVSRDDNMPYILVTSRNQEWKEDIEVLYLNELNLEDAIELVKKGLKISKDDESQEQEIEKLVKKLQCFPLALQQAVAHIREEKKKLRLRGNREYTIGCYLEEYKKKKQELLNSKAFQSLDNHYAKTTFTTWKVTTNKIKDNMEYGQLSLEILNLVAYFAPNIIPVQFFFAKLEKDNEKLWKAVELLNQYSMIKLDHGEFDVHRLVKEVTRLYQVDREKEVLEGALKLFQDGISEVDLFSDNLHLSNVDHAICVWSYANKYEELVRKFSSLPVLIGNELKATLRYQEAYLFGSNALKLLQQILGDNHLSVLSMMYNIASVLYTQGKDNDSLEIYRKLKEKLNIVSELRPEAIRIDTYIGLILNRQGKYDEALEIFLHPYILFKEEKIYSDGSIEHNLALTLFNKNRLDDAFKMYKNALERKKAVLGFDHKSTLNTENSIVAVLEKQGKYDEALEKSKEIYEKRKRILGLNHPDTLTTYGNIALYLNQQMQNDEALKIAIEVEKEREKLFPKHPRTLKGKYLIVGILDAQCKYDEALEKCKEVYEKRKQVLGLNHTDTLDTLNTWYCLALKFSNQCKYDKALKELHEVLEEKNKILNPNHLDILRTQDIQDAIGKVHRARDGTANSANMKFKFNDPKLSLAAQKGQLEIVNELLSQNAYASVQTGDVKYTPLHLAAQNGHARVVETLLEKEAIVNAKAINGSTALHIAAHRNYLDVVNALLQGGADVNCYDNALFRPLHFAAQEGHTKIIELLLKNGADIEATNVEGLTPLHTAAYFKHLDVVKSLLEGGANIDARNEKNLKTSDITNDESIKKVLLSTNQLLNVIGRQHNQPNIQQLLENGAVINYFSGTSRLTSLHYAVSKGNLEIVGLLLENKPDVNVADEDGWTPIHYAAQDGHLGIVKLLLEYGADRSIENRDRKTPLQLAEERFDQNPKIYQKIKDLLS